MTTLWERLDADPFEEIEVTLNGKTQTIMKADINVKFEGTYEELLVWAEEVFKNPGGLQVRVQFGDAKAAPMNGATNAVPSAVPRAADQVFEPGCRSGVSRETFAAFSELIGPQPWTNLPPADLLRREIALAGIVQSMRAGTKIEAIKDVRQFTHCGLKQAKDFVEGMTFSAAFPMAGSDEEIPF